MSFIYTFQIYIIYFLWDLKYLKHFLNIISENGFGGSTRNFISKYKNRWRWFNGKFIGINAWQVSWDHFQGELYRGWWGKPANIIPCEVLGEIWCSLKHTRRTSKSDLRAYRRGNKTMLGSEEGEIIRDLKVERTGKRKCSHPKKQLKMVEPWNFFFFSVAIWRVWESNRTKAQKLVGDMD